MEANVTRRPRGSRMQKFTVALACWYPSAPNASYLVAQNLLPDTPFNLEISPTLTSFLTPFYSASSPLTSPTAAPPTPPSARSSPGSWRRSLLPTAPRGATGPTATASTSRGSSVTSSGRPSSGRTTRRCGRRATSWRRCGRRARSWTMLRRS